MRAPAFLLVWLLARTAAGSGYEELGPLERQAADDALALRGLTIDPAPEGLQVGRVHVVNLDVFLPRERVPLVWANFFHFTTREQHIRRESLLQPGDTYRQVLAEETTRNLHDPSLSNVVAVLPVKAPRPGSVDVLIVTRDVWSLRLNTDFNHQQGQLTFFTASLSENNLLGRRKNLAAVFVMDQGSLSLGPNYIDPNIMGTRLKLQAAFYWTWARRPGELAAGAYEGTSSRFRLEYPLWSLARRWGAWTDFSHRFGVVRQFQGTTVRLVPLDGSPRNACDPVPAPPPGVPRVPWRYRQRQLGITSAVTRSFPLPALIHRVSAGHELGLRRPSFTDDFPDDLTLRTLFSRQVFPRSERTSGLFARYELFTPAFRTLRNFDTFDFREDVRLGPAISLKLGRASAVVGSERDFSSFESTAELATDWLGGVQRVAASGEARLEEGSLTDRLLELRISLATPVLARAARLLAAGSAGVLSANQRKRYFAVGGDDGLRGYPVDEFVGCGAQYLAHFEARTMPLHLAFLRLGGLVFYDAGHAAAEARALALYHDAGVGLRLLIPQLNTYALRADWAFPLRASPTMPAGWPGRLSLGFRQVF
jgi:hypothetical protein